MRKPELKPDWKTIVRRAWSVRLMVLAALLSGAEVILPLFSQAMPRNLFAALSFVAVAGAFVARLLVQKEVD